MELEKSLCPRSGEAYTKCFWKSWYLRVHNYFVKTPVEPENKIQGILQFSKDPDLHIRAVIIKMDCRNFTWSAIRVTNECRIHCLSKITILFKYPISLQENTFLQPGMFITKIYAVYFHERAEVFVSKAQVPSLVTADTRWQKGHQTGERRNLVWKGKGNMEPPLAQVQTLHKISVA